MYLKGQGSWDTAFLFKVHKMIRNNPRGIWAKVTVGFNSEVFSVI